MIFYLYNMVQKGEFMDIDNEMVALNDELNARICYNEFAGECFDQDGNEMVIVSMPDASGCLCENSDGDETFMKLHNLKIPKDKFTRLEEIKKNDFDYC